MRTIAMWRSSRKKKAPTKVGATINYKNPANPVIPLITVLLGHIKLEDVIAVRGCIVYEICTGGEIVGLDRRSMCAARNLNVIHNSFRHTSVNRHHFDGDIVVSRCGISNAHRTIGLIIDFEIVINARNSIHRSMRIGRQFHIRLQRRRRDIKNFGGVGKACRRKVRTGCIDRTCLPTGDEQEFFRNFGTGGLMNIDSVVSATREI